MPASAAIRLAEPLAGFMAAASTSGLSSVGRRAVVVDGRTCGSRRATFPPGVPKEQGEKEKREKKTVQQSVSLGRLARALAPDTAESLGVC